jgi:hypothetical protein
MSLFHRKKHDKGIEQAEKQAHSDRARDEGIECARQQARSDRARLNQWAQESGIELTPTLIDAAMRAGARNYTIQQITSACPTMLNEQVQELMEDILRQAKL